MSELIEASSFSPAAYIDLVRRLRALGYEPRNYSDVDPVARHFILRHDVDFSLAAAVGLAEIEAELHVASTYFVLLRTEFYNPVSKLGLDAIRRIAGLGHTIGLHFDAALYSADPDDLEAAMAQELTVLESLIARPVPVVSFHRPAAERIGDRDRWAGRLNAYGPRFVREIGYCSDSRGAWYHGQPLDHAAVKAGTAIQILIHPFWWQRPPLEPSERLRRFLAAREEFLDHELGRHCTVHQPRNRPGRS